MCQSDFIGTGYWCLGVDEEHRVTMRSQVTEVVCGNVSPGTTTQHRHSIMPKSLSTLSVATTGFNSLLRSVLAQRASRIYESYSR